MAFDIDVKHWSTISAFTDYLRSIPRPSWCKGITNHNTFHPNEHEWRGAISMQSMKATYIAKGWSSGPNLYLVAECQNPTDVGIWQMTPIVRPGTHAGECNKDHLGVENCGDFDAAPPSAAQMTMLLAVNRAILVAWGMVPDSVLVHNECMAGRTCPGKHLTGPMIRDALRGAWISPIDPFAAWGPIGKPSGAATGFAVPRAWLANKVLGACVVGETYSASGKYSVAEFVNGIIVYYKARNAAEVRLF